MTNPPPGWYMDPEGKPRLLRWWDGSQWSPATRHAEEAGGPSGEGGETGERGSGTGPGGHPASSGPPQPGPPGTPTPGPPGTGGPQPGGGKKGLIWALAGGGAFVLLVVVVLVVGFLVPGVFVGEESEPTSPTSTPTAAGTQPASPRVAPEPTGTTSAPARGTITDEQAGLKYTRLGGDWSIDDSPPGPEWTAGQLVTLQRNFDGAGNDYGTDCLSGPLSSSIPYDDSTDLRRAAERTADDQLRRYPSHGKQRTDSRAMTVGGEHAWLVRDTLTFPQAEANGWRFDTEWVAVVVVDQAAGDRPGVFLISVPNNHPTQADYTTLLDSLDTL